ncbi:MAG: choice-of-anchor D domain-containing protein [Myxococcota bacterium]
MQKRSWLLYGLLASPLASCQCETNLSNLPQPKAVLSHEDKSTPPESHLTVAMAPVLLGETGQVSLQLRNEGDATLEVGNVVLKSDPELCPQASANFAIAEPAPNGGARKAQVAVGANIPVTVRFHPSTGAPECATLVVQSNDPEHAELKAVITSKGDAPRLCVDKVLVDFGDVQVGQTKQETVTLSSCGTRPISLASLSTNNFFPPFAHDPVTLPAELAVGQQLPLTVHFSPTEAGVYNQATGRAGVISLTSEAGEVYQITLEGRGLAPPSCILDVSPAAITFGTVTDGQPRTQDVLLTNLGELGCTLSAVEVRAPAGPFSVALLGMNVGDQVAPQQVATARVTFTPGGNTGSFTGTLDVRSDDPVRPELSVALEANIPGDDGCQIIVDPAALNFGSVPVNTMRTLPINVQNISSEFCFINGVNMAAGSDPAFVDTASNFGLIPAGGTKVITVGFRPTTAGFFTGTLNISTNDSDSPDFAVALTGRTGQAGICVQPRHLDFGVVNTPTTQEFQVSACGATSVTVNALDFTQPDAEFTVAQAPTLPFTLDPGQAQTVRIQYAPADQDGDTAVLTVRSNDPAAPAIDVTMTGGPEIVPPSAGRYLYYWQIPSIVGGDVMKFPLQGATTPDPFWGPRTGKQCAGCHSVSPDGKYVAVTESAFMRFVEADTGLELILGDQFTDPQYFSWRPDVNTNPPYQFAYATGNIIKIAALYDGFLRELEGAADTSVIQTMPSWGTNGKIAFVRGNQAAQSSNGNGFGVEGPTDILLVDEDGGVPELVVGASANGKGNYYPQFSPNALWIAFTQSAAAQSTIAAEDAQIRLVRADNSGTVLNLPTLNGTAGDGANSYSTWARDGTFLSFSSNRSGGMGDWDIYLAPVDPVTGADSAATNVADLNTSAFEHAAQWSP